MWLSDLLLSLRVQDDEAENYLLYFNFGIVVDERVAANEERTPSLDTSPFRLNHKRAIGSRINDCDDAFFAGQRNAPPGILPLAFTKERVSFCIGTKVLKLM